MSPTHKDKSFHLDENGHLTFSPDDEENPKNWSTKKKVYITAVCISLVMNATFSSSAPTGILNGISQEFHVPVEVANLVTTLFLLGYCAGPLVWAPFSEFYGRRLIFRITFVAYFAFTFLCAFTPTFTGLAIGRFLTGVFASCALTNAPGVLSDIWQTHERGKALIIFAVMTFVGPALAPVITGFLQVKESWRWCFYVLLWLAAGTMIPLFTIPETFANVLLLEKAKYLRQQEINGCKDILAPVETTDRRMSVIFKVSLLRPWTILFDVICLLTTIYYSVVYTLLYMLFTIYPIVFQQKRGWNAGVGELPLIGVILGGLLGGCILLFIATRDKNKSILTGRTFTPEDRLPPAMAGGILFALTMFFFAWTAEFNSIPWIVPTIAGTLLSMSILLLFVAYINYLVDSYLGYAASAVAANTVCRSACAAASPLFTQYMFDTLGVGGGGSLIGGVAVLLAPIPFLFYRNGATLRQRSKFAPKEDVERSNQRR